MDFTSIWNEIWKMGLGAAVFLCYVYQTEILRSLQSRNLCRGKHKRQQKFRSRRAEKHTRQTDVDSYSSDQSSPKVLLRRDSKRLQLISTPSAYRRRLIAAKIASSCDLTQTSDESSASRHWHMAEEARIPDSLTDVDVDVEFRDNVPPKKFEPSSFSTPPRHRRVSSLGQSGSAVSSVSKSVRRKLLEREKSWSTAGREGTPTTRQSLTLL